MADKPPTLPYPAGWNDPPTLPVSAGPSSGRTRLNLNKRVAFPLQGTLTSNEYHVPKPTAIVPPHVSGPCPVAVVHPMPIPNTVPRIASNADNDIRQDRVILPDNAMEETLRILHEHVGGVQESPNVRQEEIRRRLGLIEQAWESGNLSNAVKEKVFCLAKCVADRNSNEAMQIYTNLVMNHSSDCTMWAVALRHIVLTVQANNASNMEMSSTAVTNAIGLPESYSEVVIPRQGADSETPPMEQPSSIQHI